MPELPEVETVRRVLENQIIDKRIVDILVKYERIIDNLNKEEFIKELKNQTILKIERLGKYLIFNLSHGYLISHLRMEGKYKFDYDKDDKHSHIIFLFNDGNYLVYNDVRKFGKMYYFDKSLDIYNLYPLNQLGKEPFELENGTYLFEKTKNSRLKLKQILLDQSILAGIGNIYADEICFMSGLSPALLANMLTLKQCDDIVHNAKIVLSKAIQLGGSTVKTYQSAHGVDGKFQNELLIYGRNNLPCFKCNTKILKTKIAGRGTCYCPKCQGEIL